MLEDRGALDRVLTGLDVHVDDFAICEVARGWRLRFDSTEPDSVYYGLTGSGLLLSADAPVPVFPDSFVVVPPRSAHSLEPLGGSTREVDADARERRLSAGMARIRAGEADAEVEFTFACGRIRAFYGQGLEIFAGLKEPIVETFAESDSLRNSFADILTELGHPTVGTRALADTLLKHALVLLLRRLAEQGQLATPWLAAVNDRRLGRAVLAMVERPAEPFTLEQLAGMAGMSRSGFAEHFSTAFGRSPIEFLREVRLRRAARLLDTTDLPVKTVANSVGYTSRSYFSRAFRQLYGVDPASFRRRSRASAPRDMVQGRA